MTSTLFDAPPEKLIPVIARYRGRCGLCHHRILAHEEEIVRVHGEWVHADCASAEGHEVMGDG